MVNETLKLNDTDPGAGFFIQKNGDVIGVVEMSGNRLMEIHIDDEFRGEGYGKKVIKQLKKEIKPDYDRINTSAVISPALQSILSRNGFEPSDEDPSHWVCEL